MILDGVYPFLHNNKATGEHCLEFTGNIVAAVAEEPVAGTGRTFCSSTTAPGLTQKSCMLPRAFWVAGMKLLL